MVRPFGQVLRRHGQEPAGLAQARLRAQVHHGVCAVQHCQWKRLRLGGGSAAQPRGRVQPVQQERRLLRPPRQQQQQQQPRDHAQGGQHRGQRQQYQ